MYPEVKLTELELIVKFEGVIGVYSDFFLTALGISHINDDTTIGEEKQAFPEYHYSSATHVKDNGDGTARLKFAIMATPLSGKNLITSIRITNDFGASIIGISLPSDMMMWSDGTTLEIPRLEVEEKNVNDMVDTTLKMNIGDNYSAQVKVYYHRAGVVTRHEQFIESMCIKHNGKTKAINGCAEEKPAIINDVNCIAINNAPIDAPHDIWVISNTVELPDVDLVKDLVFGTGEIDVRTLFVYEPFKYIEDNTVVISVYVNGIHVTRSFVAESVDIVK